MHVRTYAEHASRLDTKIENILNPTPKVPILLSICFNLLFSYHHHVVSYRNLFLSPILILLFFSSRLYASYCLLLISSFFIIRFSCFQDFLPTKNTHIYPIIFSALFSIFFSISFQIFFSILFHISS